MKCFIRPNFFDYFNCSCQNHHPRTHSSIVHKVVNSRLIPSNQGRLAVYLDYFYYEVWNHLSFVEVSIFTGGLL